MVSWFPQELNRVLRLVLRSWRQYFEDDHFVHVHEGEGKSRKVNPGQITFDSKHPFFQKGQ